MKCLIVGEKYRDKLEISLKNHGFVVFWLPENPYIDPRLASHCDLSLFIYGKQAIAASYLRSNIELVNYLTNRGCELIFSDFEQGCAYPKDVNLCALAVGGKLIHNSIYTDAAIKRNYGFDIVQVKQGYARCTALAVDERSIITADEGIAAAAERAGINVLKLNRGFVKLDGFDEGFIGGASFKAGSTVYFTGRLDEHPDSGRIKDFIESRGMCCLSLTNEALFDIGGALCID